MLNLRKNLKTRVYLSRRSLIIAVSVKGEMCNASPATAVRCNCKLHHTMHFFIFTIAECVHFESFPVNCGYKHEKGAKR